MSGGGSVDTTEDRAHAHQGAAVNQLAGSVADTAQSGRVELSASQGLELLCIVARLHGVAVDAASLSHQLALTEDAQADFDVLRLAAQKLNLKARVESVALHRLRYTPLPALTQLADGSWAMVAAANESQVLVQHSAPKAIGAGSVAGAVPAEDLPVRMTHAEFAQAWIGGAAQSLEKPSGPMLLIASRASLVGDIARFDFSWFIPSLVRYRRLLGEVLGASVVLQLFALVTPLFFQVVMDSSTRHQRRSHGGQQRHRLHPYRPKGAHKAGNFQLHPLRND